MKRAAPPQILTSTPSGRTLLFSFEAGQGVPPHRHLNARVTIAVLSGEVEVSAENVATLSTGEVTVHEGSSEVSLRALTDSRVLVCLIQQ